MTVGRSARPASVIVLAVGCREGRPRAVAFVLLVRVGAGSRNPEAHQDEEITLELVQRAAAVRVTDGCISQLAWSNPDKSATHDVFIRVQETSPEEIERVKLRIDQLLGLA